AAASRCIEPIITGSADAKCGEMKPAISNEAVARNLNDCNIATSPCPKLNQGESNRRLASVKARFDTRKMVRNSKTLIPQAEATFVYFHTIVFDIHGQRTLVADCKK